MEEGMYKEQENSHLDWPEHTRGLEDKPSVRGQKYLAVEEKKSKYLEVTDK